MLGCLSGGSSIKLLVIIYRLFLPLHSDVGDRTVYSRYTVYLLLKHLTQQVAHGLCNVKAPSRITQGMTGKIQNSVLQIYPPPLFYPDSMIFNLPPFTICMIRGTLGKKWRNILILTNILIFLIWRRQHSLGSHHRGR